MEHVPSCYNMVLKGTNVSQRLFFIETILATKGISYSIDDLDHYVKYLSKFCPSFLANLGTSATELFDLSNTRYNRFLAPPVWSCLSCGQTLKMHNAPSKAMVFGLAGSLPSTKITLECRDCAIQYGIGKYCNSKGHHYYPKEQRNTRIVEVSNVTYIDHDLYKWIPSLG